ncbi:hypothetical protein NHQ30_005943 [Ciborinia camelliae]|nr:hypothetical protein NHQ30_005943 [Ciborinia camelliae]
MEFTSRLQRLLLNNLHPNSAHIHILSVLSDSENELQAGRKQDILKSFSYITSDKNEKDGAIVGTLDRILQTSLPIPILHTSLIAADTANFTSDSNSPVDTLKSAFGTLVTAHSNSSIDTLKKQLQSEFGTFSSSLTTSLSNSSVDTLKRELKSEFGTLSSSLTTSLSNSSVDTLKRELKSEFGTLSSSLTTSLSNSSVDTLKRELKSEFGTLSSSLTTSLSNSSVDTLKRELKSEFGTLSSSLITAHSNSSVDTLKKEFVNLSSSLVDANTTNFTTHSKSYIDSLKLEFGNLSSSLMDANTTNFTNHSKSSMNSLKSEFANLSSSLMDANTTNFTKHSKSTIETMKVQSTDLAKSLLNAINSQISESFQSMYQGQLILERQNSIDLSLQRDEALLLLQSKQNQLADAQNYVEAMQSHASTVNDCWKRYHKSALRKCNRLATQNETLSALIIGEKLRTFTKTYEVATLTKQTIELQRSVQVHKEYLSCERAKSRQYKLQCEQRTSEITRLEYALQQGRDENRTLSTISDKVSEALSAHDSAFKTNVEKWNTDVTKTIEGAIPKVNAPLTTRVIQLEIEVSTLKTNYPTAVDLLFSARPDDLPGKLSSISDRLKTIEEAIPKVNERLTTRINVSNVQSKFPTAREILEAARPEELPGNLSGISNRLRSIETTIPRIAAFLTTAQFRKTAVQIIRRLHAINHTACKIDEKTKGLKVVPRTIRTVDEKCEKISKYLQDTMQVNTFKYMSKADSRQFTIDQLLGEINIVCVNSNEKSERLEKAVAHIPTTFPMPIDLVNAMSPAGCAIVPGEQNFPRTNRIKYLVTEGIASSASIWDTLIHDRVMVLQREVKLVTESCEDIVSVAILERVLGEIAANIQQLPAEFTHRLKQKLHLKAKWFIVEKYIPSPPKAPTAVRTASQVKTNLRSLLQEVEDRATALKKDNLSRIIHRPNQDLARAAAYERLQFLEDKGQNDKRDLLRTIENAGKEASEESKRERKEMLKDVEEKLREMEERLREGL